MPYRYGAQSLANRRGVDPQLLAVFDRVLEFYDHSILQGVRSREDQDAAEARGASTLRWPRSKHNVITMEQARALGLHPRPYALAMDVAPYPVNFANKSKAVARFYHFAGVVQGVARTMGVRVRWGGDWDRDHDFADQSFDDLVHFELLT